MELERTPPVCRYCCPHCSVPVKPLSHISDIEDLPPAVQEKLFDEVLDRDVQKGTEGFCVLSTLYVILLSMNLNTAEASVKLCLEKHILLKSRICEAYLFPHCSGSIWETLAAASALA